MISLLVALTLTAAPECVAERKITTSLFEALENERAKSSTGFPYELSRAKAADSAEQPASGVLVVTRAGMSWQGGHPLKSRDELVSELSRAGSKDAELHAILHGGRAKATAPDPMIAVAPDAPWSLVVAATEAFRLAGARRARFLFDDAAHPPVARPGPSSADWLFANGKVKPLQEVGDELQRISGKLALECPEMNRVAPPKTRDDVARYLKEARTKLVPKCPCDFDYPALRALMWALFHETPQVVATLALEEGGEAVRTGADKPWSQTGSLVLAAAQQKKAVRLSVAE